MAKDALKIAVQKAVKNMQVHQVPEKKVPRGAQALASSPSTYYPPNLYLSDEDFPGIEGWKAGDKVSLAVTATVKNVSVSQQNNEKKRWNADLELTAIADITAGGKDGGKA